MTLRELLKVKPETRKETVTYNDSTFILEGKNDGSIMIKLTADQEELKKKVNHYNVMYKVKTITPSFMVMVMAIHCSLVPEDPKKPYEEHEIVGLGLEYGNLFTKLSEAAIKVLGLADKDGDDQLSVQAVGN
jgi:hypothetical protein